MHTNSFKMESALSPKHISLFCFVLIFWRQDLFSIVFQIITCLGLWLGVLV